MIGGRAVGLALAVGLLGAAAASGCTADANDTRSVEPDQPDAAAAVAPGVTAPGIQVSADLSVAPVVEIPDAAAPAHLVVDDVVVGSGPRSVKRERR